MAEKRKYIENATLEGVRIGFRNFSGKEGKFNREGDRNFHIFLDKEIAEQMLEDGWNVKFLEPRDEEDEPQAHLKVKVNFRNRPPRVFLVTSQNKTALNEDMVDVLDWADIKYSDVIITPYHYDVNGNTGVTAYLQAIYATIQEDDLHHKYADVPDSAQSATFGQGELTTGDEDVVDVEAVEGIWDEPKELEA